MYRTGRQEKGVESEGGLCLRYDLPQTHSALLPQQVEGLDAIAEVVLVCLGS